MKTFVLLLLTFLVVSCASGVDRRQCGNYGIDNRQPLHVTRADKGKRNSDDVRKVIDKKRLDIYRLFGKRSRENPCLQGKIIYRLTIKSTGEVERVSLVASAANDAAFEKQLGRLLKGYNYGTVEDPMDISVVTYTLTFNGD